MQTARLDLSGNAEGALWILASVMGATGMTLAIRYLAGDVHTSMIVFLRSVLALVALAPLALRARRAVRRGRPPVLRFSAWKLHLARGLLLAVTLLTGYYSIWKLPLATAAILFFLAPVFATVLAIPMLGEKVGPRRWAAAIAGFVGAAIILRPGSAEIGLPVAAAIASALAFALALLVGRRVTDRDGTDSVFVSSTVVVAAVTLAPALPHWQIPGELWQWGVLGLLVLASSVRTYSDIRAYAVGDAGFLAPFTYLRLITVGAAGYLLFGERIDGATLLGGAVIVGATLYIALRERAIGRAARRPRTP